MRAYKECVGWLVAGARAEKQAAVTVVVVVVVVEWWSGLKHVGRHRAKHLRSQPAVACAPRVLERTALQGIQVSLDALHNSVSDERAAGVQRRLLALHAGRLHVRSVVGGACTASEWARHAT